MPSTGSFTNLAGATLRQGGTTGLNRNWQNGTLTFYNQGVWSYSNTARGGFAIRGGVITVRNEGLVDAIANGNVGNWYSDQNDSTFINAASGTFRQKGTGTFNFEWGSAGARILCEGGTWVATNGGTLDIGWDSDTLVSTVVGTTFDSTDGTINLVGGMSNVFGTAVGNPLRCSSINPKTGGAEINVGGEGFLWSSGAAINHGTEVMTLSGTTYATHTGLTRLNGGSGHLRNTGHFFADFGDLGIDMQSDSEFRNAGIFEIVSTAGNREIYERAGSAIFYNEATGVITQNVSGTFQFHGDNSGATFRNAGTIVMNAGTLALHSPSWVNSSSTVNNGDLLEGTWRCEGGSINTPASNIDTISTNAKVVLGATGDFSDMTTASFKTLYGTFGLHGGRTWTTGGALTTGVSSAFEFGISTGVVSKLTLSAPSTIQGAIHVVDQGLTVGLYTVIDFSSGDLTDGGIIEGILTTDQELFMDVIVSELDDTVVIEIRDTPTGTELLFQ